MNLKSRSYSEDIKIIDHCKQNTDDSRCECVLNQNASLDVLTFTQYVCVSPACFDDKKFSLYYTQNEQKRCKQNKCQIYLQSAKFRGSNDINIENQCSNVSLTNIIEKYFYEEPLIYTYDPKIIFYNKIIMLLGSFLFLI